MKSVYLFLVATAAVATCKPQRSNNDIIWYPVDGEDGTFISIYGEKYRTTPYQKTRSHRRARFSGPENSNRDFSIRDSQEKFQDPSFFHNVRERRRGPAVPKFPPSFNQNPYPNNPFLNSKRIDKKSQYETLQNFDENGFKEIINEVFDTHKQPVYDLPHQRPSQWESSPNSPLIDIDYPNLPNNADRPNKPRRPNRPNKNTKPTKPKRPTTESDILVFPEDTIPTRRTTTPSNRLPTEAPTLSPCERACPVTPEFNPVCGTDSVTYSNAGKLKCAQMCGKDVFLSHYGNCGRTRLVTPPLSDNPLQRPRKRGNKRKNLGNLDFK